MIVIYDQRLTLDEEALADLIAALVGDAVKNHNDPTIMQRIFNKTPEYLKKALNRVGEVSSKEIEKAVKTISQYTSLISS